MDFQTFCSQLNSYLVENGLPAMTSEEARQEYQHYQKEEAVRQYLAS